MENGAERDDAATGPDVREVTGTRDGREPYDWREDRARFGWKCPVLPGEDPGEIKSLYDYWFNAFQPASCLECDLLEMTVYDLVDIRRCRVSLAAGEQLLTYRTRDAWDAARHCELERSKGRLGDDPAGAVAELAQSATGCRWMIECWEACTRFLDAYPVDDFTERGILGREFDPCQRVFLAYHAAGKPAGPGIQWVCAETLPEGSLERLRAALESELPRLRAGYERLHAEVECPALDEAIAAAIAADEHRKLVIRRQRHDERAFQDHYRLLLQWRGGPPPPGLPPMPPEPPARKARKPARPRKR
jgi:hypothetical protein